MTGRCSRLVAVLCCLVAVVTTGCRSGRQPGPAASSSDRSVVVASFNFAESELVAEIYAQALEAKGVPVRRELGLGPRELVLPALHQGEVDVVPEYLGSALSAVVPGAHAIAADSAAALSELRGALQPWRVRVLDPAPAQNQNGLTVTEATARRLSLRTISDLRDRATRMTLGGPFECTERTYCLLGLQRVYGLRFARFLPFDTEDQRATALTEGVVDVAVMFTTDGRLAGGDLVLLADDQRLQPPENLVPVVSERAIARYGSLLTGTLDAVSAALTTRSLVLLNWRTGVAHRDIAAEARGWLRRHDLAPRQG